jgi:hypothetical protein
VKRVPFVVPFLLVFLVVAALLSPARARAAAYYVGEVGAKSIARGGANIVDPQDPSAAWLNPAAITRSTGLQLNIDLNLVWLASSFTRDCGGKDNGCAPLEDVSKSYADNKHKFTIKDRRATFDPDAGAFTSYPAEPGELGQYNTPSQFDGKTAVTNQAGVQPIPRAYLSFNTATTRSARTRLRATRSSIVTCSRSITGSRSATALVIGSAWARACRWSRRGCAK